MKKLTVCLLIFVLALSLFGLVACGKKHDCFANEDGYCTECNEPVPTEGVYYKNCGTYAAVQGYTGDATTVVIAKTYNELPVTTVEADAFKYGTFKKMVLPEGITHIEENAFRGCTDLEKIDLPSTLKKIDEAAFSNCSALKSLVIPAGVEEIGAGALAGCGSLESLTLPFVGARKDTTKDSKYQYPYGYIFGKAKFAPARPTTQEYIGKYLDETEEAVFYIPTSLISLTVTGGEILYGAFTSCSMLEEVNLPENLTYIGDDAFTGCRGLKSIEIPDSITHIGDGAFYMCEKLEGTEKDSLIYLGNPGNPYLCLYSATGGGLKEMTIADGCRFVTGDFVNYCSSLEKITVPASVEKLSPYALVNSLALETIIVAEDSKYYKSVDNCLYTKDGKTLVRYAPGKSGTNFVAPEGLENVGEFAFALCMGIERVELPSTLKTIGAYAFLSCRYLNRVVLQDGEGWLYTESYYDFLDGVGRETSLDDPVAAAEAMLYEMHYYWMKKAK